MARNPTPEGLDEAAAKVNDPGGAHTKGYTAETGPDPNVPAEGPLPLAPGRGGAIQQPERDGDVQPTGRQETGDAPYNRVIESGE